MLGQLLRVAVLGAVCLGLSAGMAGAVPSDGFGDVVAVSADGGTAIVGAPSAGSGEVFVYVRAAGSGSWSVQATLSEAGVSAGFGSAAALSADGNTVLVGAGATAGDVGSAWVFTRSGSAWSSGVRLSPSDESGAGSFGFSVALSADGATALVGGDQDNGSRGAAWVFAQSGGLWAQQGPKLIPNNPTGSTPLFGWAVALSGDGNTALIGGPTDEDLSLAEQGDAWVFARAGGNWTQQARLFPSDHTGPAQFGYAVALSGDGSVAVVGGPFDNSNQGAAWVFTNSGGTWPQQGSALKEDFSIADPYFGRTVAASTTGQRLVLGQYGGLTTADESGSAWTLDSLNGPSLATLAEPEPALSGDGSTLVVGPGNGVAQVPVFQPATGGMWTQNSLLQEPASSSGGGGGGGGGGTGGSTPNLKVSWTAATTLTPASGSEDDFTVTVANNGSAGALQTHLLITLPSTITLLASPYYQQGSGCTGTQQVDCFLDSLASGGSTTIRFAIKISGSGSQTISATATSDRDSDSSDNTATETLLVGSPMPTPGPTPTPVTPLPKLTQLNARTLSGVPHGTTETVSGRFRTNEPLRLTATVTVNGAMHRLAILRNSILAGIRLKRTSTTWNAAAGRAGSFGFRLLMERHALQRGRTYLVHLTAANSRGRKARLTIRFRPV